MADLKISQLTGATTPLAGTEVLPIVQSGATRQVSVANLTAGRTQTSNGIVQGTAGTGYNFTANTPAAGMTSQLLNWYEEGTWTPSIGATTTNPTTPITGTGRYTRVGRQVTVSFTVSGNAAGAAGVLFVSGFPFTASSSGLGYGPCTMSGLGTDVAVLRVNNSDNYATLITATTNAFVNIVATTISVNGTVTYLV